MFRKVKTQLGMQNFEIDALVTINKSMTEYHH